MEFRDRPEWHSAIAIDPREPIMAVTLPGGQGVHIVFRRNSDPDPVTGKIYRDEVEE